MPADPADVRGARREMWCVWWSGFVSSERKKRRIELEVVFGGRSSPPLLSSMAGVPRVYGREGGR